MGAHAVDTNRPLPSLTTPGAMGKDEHVLSHMINIGRFWMFSLYYVVSELWGSVSVKDGSGMRRERAEQDCVN